MVITSASGIVLRGTGLTYSFGVAVIVCVVQDALPSHAVISLETLRLIKILNELSDSYVQVVSQVIIPDMVCLTFACASSRHRFRAASRATSSGLAAVIFLTTQALTLKRGGKA